MQTRKEITKISTEINEIKIRKIKQKADNLKKINKTARPPGRMIMKKKRRHKQY